MDFNSLKQQVIALIEEISSKDVTKLYQGGAKWVAWNEMQPQELIHFVDAVIQCLKKLPTNSILLDGLGQPQVRTIFKQLQNFSNELNNLEQFPLKAISTEHHNALNHLHSINHTLRSSGLMFELNAYPDISNVHSMLREVEEAKKTTFEDSKLVEQLRIQAENDLRGKVSADLRLYLSDSHRRYRDLSLAILLAFILVILLGFYFVIHPLFQEFILFVVGSGEATLMHILVKIPQSVLFFSILYVLGIFYRRYENLALSMEHKNAVVGSLPTYTKLIFDDVGRLSDERNKEAMRKEAILFNIRSLEKVFEQPAVSEKMMKIQAGVHDKGMNFAFGDNE